MVQEDPRGSELEAEGEESSNYESGEVGGKFQARGTGVSLRHYSDKVGRVPPLMSLTAPGQKLEALWKELRDYT